MVDQLVAFRADTADVQPMPCRRNKRGEDALTMGSRLAPVQAQQALSLNRVGNGDAGCLADGRKMSIRLTRLEFSAPPRLSLG